MLVLPLVVAYLNAKFHLAKDLSSLLSIHQGLRNYERALASNRGNVWFVFAETAARYPDMICLWTRDVQYTYREVLVQCAQYAHFFRQHGVQPGDLVAFYLQNRAEFLIAWLALLSVGAAPAAINYHLVGDALLHCLRISGARHLLVDPDDDCRARVDDVQTTIESDLRMEIHVLDKSFQDKLSTLPSTVPDNAQHAHGMAGSFPAILLYTSGTTGLPKGCAFTMSRLYSGLMARRGFVDNRNGPHGDRWYSCMPLYHGTTAMSLVTCLVTGVSIAVGRRFSTRTFWHDIHDSQATVFVYVGEVARYLLAAPPSSLDRNHRVHCIYGNGLRPDVWERFRQRFGISTVGEFFNSTEGLFVLFNYNRGPFSAGCVGHHGLLMRWMLRDVYVPVAVDPVSGDVLRNEQTGLAVRNSYEEGGEMLVQIASEDAFQGYWGNDSATRKKFIRDVLRKGDLYYRSGDALRRQSDGRWYFLDRLGDTFRWKSENVATAEVSQILGQYPGVQEANVYGVSIPHHDGRAGCAAIQIHADAQADFDFVKLAQFARARLPKYAVPVFLRLVQKPSHIHNLKQNKVPLRDEGVDPQKIAKSEDQLYWLPPGEESYRPFGGEEWEDLNRGRARL
ncbi:hypothetical protein EYZ11_000912 [Aspergillus tanneri]|uniref:Very long-chain fatty acid transport protein n=1 Tax=Aspergillus tanneri TaxID=1220188 RepID=A0A4S3JW31_9EURO|nr:uncharacterized protein ATNIH1004_010107 [Aspergillus tanneri]KAA8643340.1 hypothetical protein ATNIH1004_010107 [Aspergillus tanneri]THC99645.1 hypothetical protein EYZ11_000912 [Aspergillus tanneri]